MHVVDVDETQNTAAMTRIMVTIVVGGGDEDEDVDVAGNDEGCDEAKKSRSSKRTMLQGKEKDRKSPDNKNSWNPWGKNGWTVGIEPSTGLGSFNRNNPFINLCWEKKLLAPKR